MFLNRPTKQNLFSKKQNSFKYQNQFDDIAEQNEASSNNAKHKNHKSKGYKKASAECMKNQNQFISNCAAR